MPTRLHPNHYRLHQKWDLGTAFLDDPRNLQALTLIPQDQRDPPIWIVDVRPGWTYNGGHIPTAISRPSSDIANRLEDTPLDDPDNYIIVYCETGIRAQGVINDYLLPNGNTRVMHWGGITNWPYGLE
jgi:rhodanese-related sulfurtransferase